MSADEFGQLRQVILQKVKVGSRQKLPAYVAATADLDVYLEPLAQMLIASLRAYVLAEHLVNQEHEVSLEVPASWWDHFKRDSRLWARLPGRLRDRRPVRYTRMKRTVTFNRYHAYPEASILPSGRFGAPVVWEAWEPGAWDA